MQRPHLFLVLAAFGALLLPVRLPAQTPARFPERRSTEAAFDFPTHDGQPSADSALRRDASSARTITPPSRGRTAPSQADGKKARTSGSWGTAMGALAFVVVLIVVAAKLWKKHGPAIARGLPRDAVDILGKKYVDQRQSIYLVRCGSRILILGSAANGLQTLAEVTDPVEVDYLAGLCRPNNDEPSGADSFLALFKKSAPSRSSNAESTAPPGKPIRRNPTRLEEVHG